MADATLTPGAIDIQSYGSGAGHEHEEQESDVVNEGVRRHRVGVLRLFDGAAGERRMTR